MFHLNFGKWENLVCKTFASHSFWKSCLFRFNWTIIDWICWNKFHTYQRLALLYYFHHKILKDTIAILKECDASLLTSPRKWSLCISRSYFFLPRYHELYFYTKHVCMVVAPPGQQYYLGRWYYKSTIYKRFLNWDKIFKKIKQLLAKLCSFW